jgi:hypothetical protein
MMARRSWLGALLLLALTSCATSDSEGCANDQCRAEVHATKARLAREEEQRARQTAASEACAHAEARPAGVDPAYVHGCRVKRWQQSGIICHDDRVGDKLIEITCDVPAVVGPPDLVTASEMMQKRAAAVTLAAGRTFLVLAGEDPPFMNFRNTARYASCESTGPLGLTSDCHTVSAPAPVSATVRRHYELLTSTEAAARTSPAIAAERQPQSARQLAQTYADLP